MKNMFGKIFDDRHFDAAIDFMAAFDEHASRFRSK